MIFFFLIIIHIPHAESDFFSNDTKYNDLLDKKNYHIPVNIFIHLEMYTSNMMVSLFVEPI